MVSGLPPVAAVAAGAKGLDLPALKQPKAVPVKPVAMGGNPKLVDHSVVPAGKQQAAKAVWPSTGAAVVDVPAAGAAGAGPVEVSSAVGAASRVAVQVADPAAAERAGVDGVLLSVGRADGGGEPGKVRVKLDYTEFAGAFGGDWASRLRLVRLPGCALTTPELAECRVQQPLESVNDPKAKTVSAPVEAAAASTGALSSPAFGRAGSAGSGGTVLAATAGASGPSGDYSATPLAASGSWSAGGSTGAFNWSYPINVPSVPGGLVPSVGLGYSSQAVDGRTSASNNQPGWVGDGWSWEPGFIERRYKDCDDDQSGGTNTAKVGDLCWFTDNATLSLGGKNTELVYENGKGWHPVGDAGEKVEKLTGATNGANGGEHWKVTATDGTQYFFGLNRLPGYASGSAETKSAWTVPVYGNHAGEPCYNSTFANAWCQQAWRWQLDYVVDPRGNAMAYYWNTESNNYARNWSSSNGKGTATTYVRGGWLDRIEYGLRSDAVYSGKPMGIVRFGVDERCLDTCGSFDETNAKNWKDTPFDQYCADGADCKNNASPTFWSRKRLTAITTQVLTGGSHKDVDRWDLVQSFPPSGDGLSTPMWLASIKRTGKTNGDVALPAMTFGGEQMANRVDRTGDGLAPFIRLRLNQITNETGGTIGVYYSAPECTSDNLPATDGSNTRRCYRVKYKEGDLTKDDWFNTYVATKVVEGDNLAATPDKVTEYSFLDGVAWSLSEDEFAKPEMRTHSVYRGYGRVQTRTGAGFDQRTLTEARFFRGIDGAQVKDSAGQAVTDRPEFAGQTRENATYNGDGGALVTATSFTPWRSDPTATRNRTGLSAVTARHIGVEKEQTRTAVTGGERRTSLTRTFDGYGMVTSVSDLGDEGKTGDEFCTTTEYARNTTAWILDKSSRTETVGVACGSPVNRPADVVSDSQVFYDGSTTLGAAPAKGLVTETRGINGTGTGHDTVKKSGYDQYGRETSTTDPYGKTSTTAFTPATGEPATGTVGTNTLGHQVSAVLDPRRGQATSVTDENGKVTVTAFDALGRKTKIWLPTRSATTYPDSPNYKFDYQIRNDGPVVVSTSVLGHDSTYSTTFAISDGLNRPRQTQGPSLDRSGRVLSETFYDTRGFAWRDSGTFYADGNASDVLATGQELNYPASTDTLFDGAGRTTAVVNKRFGDETKRTVTVHHGDGTTFIPPKGGAATTTVTDARGRTVELREYTNADRTAFQTATYGYDKAGRLAQQRNSAGSTWTFGYDAQGRQVKVTDPDKGTVETTYDVGGRTTDVKDARGVTLHTDYDALGRRTALKQGATTLSEWTYDTVAKGKGATETRYVNGNAYTFAVTAYNSLYKPTMTQLTVPTSEGKLAGTYKWTTSYNLITGQELWTQHPAIGDLPAERVTRTYTPGAGLASTVYAAGTPIVSGMTYDHYGRPIREQYGEFGKQMWISSTYDEHTGQLTDTVADRELAPQRIDDTHYTYDPAGNLTKLVTNSGQDAQRVTDTQCFANDALRQITEAWTATDNCAAAPATATVGGPDAYWTSYTYDALGNRKTEVQHKTAGGPTADITRTYTTPAPNQARPHSLTKVDQTGPAGTSTETYSYDAAGNMLTRKLGNSPVQELRWNAEGRLESTLQDSKQTSYVYNAAGDRLIKRDSGGSTLYLPNGNELNLKGDPLTGTLTGTRYYTHLERTVAVRTGGKLTYLLSDHHNTATSQVDSVTLAVTRRRTTLFGAARGVQPSAWVGQRGFIGGNTDADTGLTHLGAREYDPTTGRFISVDPVVDSATPQQWNGYAYSNNNPASYSDPTGRLWFGLFSDLFADLIAQVMSIIQSVKTSPPPQTTQTYVLGKNKRRFLDHPYKDDFPYDPSVKPTWEDRKNYAKWEAKGAGGVWCSILNMCDLRDEENAAEDITDGADAYEHYLEGSGEDYELDYEGLYDSDPGIRKFVDFGLGVSQEWAEYHAQGRSSGSFDMSSDLLSMTGTMGSDTETENGDKAIGDHHIWANATVKVDGDKITMNITVNAQDRYDFNKGMQDKVSKVEDAENGRFSTLGWAKPFMSYGTVTRELTWTRGSAGSTTITKEGGGR